MSLMGSWLTLVRHGRKKKCTPGAAGSGPGSGVSVGSLLLVGRRRLACGRRGGRLRTLDRSDFRLLLFFLLARTAEGEDGLVASAGELDELDALRQLEVRQVHDVVHAELGDIQL